MVRTMLSDRTVVCLSVCNVGVLCPNGWTDQDETWHADRPQPHCVRWGPSPPSKKRHNPQFSAHVRCGQTVGWIKMSLGMEVGLVPCDFVLDGDPASPTRGGHPLPEFLAHDYCRQMARCHLAGR